MPVRCAKSRTPRAPMRRGIMFLIMFHQTLASLPIDFQICLNMSGILHNCLIRSPYFSAGKACVLQKFPDISFRFIKLSHMLLDLRELLKNTIIPAFADKSEGPHTPKMQNFDQNVDPKNVKKQLKSSYLRPIWPQNRHRLEKWRRSVVEKLKKLLRRPIAWPKTFFFVSLPGAFLFYPVLGRFCFIPS